MNQYNYQRFGGLLIRCIIPLSTNQVKTALRNMTKYYHDFNPAYAPLQSAPVSVWAEYIRNRSYYPHTNVIVVNWKDYKLTATMEEDLDIHSICKFDLLND